MTVDEQRAHDAFLDYVEAKARAEATMDFRDATAAGQAWAAFLNVFVSPGQEMPVCDIIKFPREARQ